VPDFTFFTFTFMRKQRAFKDLTEQEIDQIAEWLRHDTYEVVLDRIRKPRPEGFGFARISRKRATRPASPGTAAV